MLLRVQKYDYNIIYRPGKEMVMADRLSRFPSRRENLPIKLHHNIQHVSFTSDRINITRGAMEEDCILHTFYGITLNGWPDCIYEVPRIACHFWGARGELTVENGLLLKGDRVCMPPKLYQRMQHDPHSGHKGIKQMQHLVRDRIYRQGLDADIAEYVKHCEVCTKPHKPLNQCYPETSPKVPGRT